MKPAGCWPILPLLGIRSPRIKSALGHQTGADIVVTGLIHEYGAVQWQYWMTGWLLHVSAWTTAIGVATAWNPAAIGAFLDVDATIDFPIWYGGAEIFGWVLRPVRVHLDAFQLKPCEEPVWSDDALRVRVPGKALTEYSPEAQKREAAQVEANLNRALAELAETAREKLALRVCMEDGRPEKIRGFYLNRYPRRTDDELSEGKREPVGGRRG